MEYQEEFKVIQDYPDYEISTHGRVRSLKRGVFLKYDCSRPCVSVKLSKLSGNRKNVYVHRLMAIAFKPNPENRPCAIIKNGNILDLRLDNIEWGYVSEY